MYQENFAPVSNQVPWIEAWGPLTADDDGSLIDLSTGYAITLDIRAKTLRGPGSVGPAWGFPYTPGVPMGPVLTASIANSKITTPAPGYFQWAFTATDMQSLGPGVYEVFCRISSTGSPDTDALELFVGTLPVIQG